MSAVFTPVLRRRSVQFALASVTVAVGVYLSGSSSYAEALLAEPRVGQTGLSAVAQVPPFDQQGTQVILNGQTLAMPWSVQQGKIGVADLTLSQELGITLLNTADLTTQPVQWFSQPSDQPLNLSTWRNTQYRFLDLTPLSRQLGWQATIRGTTLNLTTSASQVLGIRQGRQTWGDRLVLDLAQPAPWRVSETAEEVTVTVDAPIDRALMAAFVPTPGNRLTSLKVETNGSKTTLRIGVPVGLRAQVSTLPAPNRLIIDIRSDGITERDIVWAPGVRWQHRVVPVGNARFPVVVLAVNPQQPGLRLRPIVGNPTGSKGTVPLLTMAQRTGVAAAINGGFFNRNNELPLGAVRLDGRWLSGPILNRGAIGWTDTGEIGFGRLNFRQTLATSTGQQLAVPYFNTAYVGAGIAVYSPEWGSSYTPLADNETIAIVQNGRVTQQRVASAAAGQPPLSIPRDGFLVVLRAAPGLNSALGVGTAVQLQTASTPDAFDRFPQVMAAGPLLVQDRRIVLNASGEGFSQAFITQLAVRSAIGKTAEGNLLIVASQNRLGGRGPSLQEMAQVMLQLGCIDALNLDGGSSTSLVLSGQMINRPPRTAARVHNGIGLFIQPSP
jgi:Phosphodiester glycosidase